jgi:hypothetical protein
MFLDNLLNLPLISRPILLEQIIRIRLRGAVRVRIVQQSLYPQQNLLYGNRRFPSLLFIQDTQTHCPTRVHVGVEKGGREFALRWLGGILVGKDYVELEVAAVPEGFFFARDAAFPFFEIEDAGGGFGGAGKEAKGVVFAPLFAEGESVCVRF